MSSIQYPFSAHGFSDARRRLSRPVFALCALSVVISVSAANAQNQNAEMFVGSIHETARGPASVAEGPWVLDEEDNPLNFDASGHDYLVHEILKAHSEWTPEQVEADLITPCLGRVQVHYRGEDKDTEHHTRTTVAADRCGAIVKALEPIREQQDSILLARLAFTACHGNVPDADIYSCNLLLTLLKSTSVRQYFGISNNDGVDFAFCLYHGKPTGSVGNITGFHTPGPSHFRDGVVYDPNWPNPEVYEICRKSLKLYKPTAGYSDVWSIWPNKAVPAAVLGACRWSGSIDAPECETSTAAIGRTHIQELLQSDADARRQFIEMASNLGKPDDQTPIGAPQPQQAMGTIEQNSAESAVAPAPTGADNINAQQEADAIKNAGRQLCINTCQLHETQNLTVCTPFPAYSPQKANCISKIQEMTQNCRNECNDTIQ